ncbi:hypothetical protein RMCBS344292_00477 [Rhizopus microsporus]|nr:hypothetical protein RMCBS344292_00477 [Rhizopus microsporus]
MIDYTVEVGQDQPNGGRIRRSKIADEGLVRVPEVGIHTLYDVLQHSAKKYPELNAFGYRKVERVIEEEKEIVKVVDGVETKQVKKWKYFQMSKYYYITYAEAAQITLDIGAGFIYLGLQEKSKVEIFAPTSMHWLLTAHGLFTQNMTIVTAYDTLGEEGLLHSMNETEVEAIFSSAELLPTVKRVAKSCPSLKLIVYQGIANHEDLDSSELGSVKIRSLDEVIKLGKEHPIDPRLPEPEDLCCIMYTSGSTGNPKGVMLSHKNVVAAVASSDAILGRLISLTDSIMAYLPLAHIFEFVTENMSLYWGITIGYGSFRTLTDTSVRNCKGDIREFQPTLMCGVPAVWEAIRKSIVTKIQGASSNAQAVFNRAFHTKAWFFERGLSTPLLDRLVFNKIREQFGGRLRCAISAGAPLAIETQKFLTITLCPIITGYGMTESTSVCTLMSDTQLSYGHVGSISPAVEMKLVDVPDAGYFSTNAKPQGEVWVRGPCVTKGYWKRDDLTKETIAEGGWLQTGDIAEWNEDGTLTIIDRKKNLVKLSNGEYIALERLESVYKSCMFVNNICIYANSLLPKPVALVVPAEKAVRALADELDVQEKDWKSVCAHAAVKKAVYETLISKAKETGLKPAEILFDIYLCSEEWTTENGLLTAAQKVKRNDIVKMYKHDLEEMNKNQCA